MNKTYLTAVTPIDLFGTIIDTGSAPPAASTFEGKSHWVYISNKSEDETEYATITIGDKDQHTLLELISMTDIIK